MPSSVRAQDQVDSGIVLLVGRGSWSWSARIKVIKQFIGAGRCRWINHGPETLCMRDQVCVSRYNTIEFPASIQGRGGVDTDRRRRISWRIGCKRQTSDD